MFIDNELYSIHYVSEESYFVFTEARPFFIQLTDDGLEYYVAPQPHLR